MNYIKYVISFIMIFLLVGCGTNFNDVQMKKIEFDQKRIEAIQAIEEAKAAAPKPQPSQLDGKYSSAGFLVETDDEGKLKTVFIGQGIINKADKTAEITGLHAIASTNGYSPVESSVVKEGFGVVKDIARFTLMGFAVDRVTGAMGTRSTVYTAGGDQAVNNGVNGVATTSTSPIADSYNNQSDNSNQGNDLSDNSNNSNQGNDLSDNSNNSNQGNDLSDNDLSDNSDNSNNSDNRNDYENQTATPTVVNPVVVDPVVVDPVIVNPIPALP